MFETGMTDTITVKLPAAAGKDSDGNPKKLWTTIIDAQQCRVVEHKEYVADQQGNQILTKFRTVGVNYSGSNLTPKCTVTINGDPEEIKSVKPARGFGRDFQVITLKGRDE